MSDKNSQNFPYEIEKLSDEENKEMADYMRGPKFNYVRVGPKKYFLTEDYVRDAANIYNMPIRHDDTFVVTYPKSGTTWTQELVWLLKNNLDFETAKSITLNERFPFLELNIFPSPIEPGDIPPSLIESLKSTFIPLTVDQIKELPSPRFIKSHLPLSLLPPSLVDTAKVVYVIREPRDVAVSFFHHSKLMKVMDEDNEFKPYWNFFIKDKVLWGPYFEHLMEAWAIKDHPNILILFYEDLLKDLPSGIRRVAKFLNKPLTDEDVENLKEHLKFDNFKKNKAVNMEEFQKAGFFSSKGGFVRQGKSGGWRNYFDEEMMAQADEWIESKLRGTDFRFPQK